MLNICTWLWGSSYGEHYVRRLAAGVHRNLNEAHRFIAFTDSPQHLPGIEQYQIPDIRLTAVKGCFVRLQLFDPEWQNKLGIAPGDRVVNLDLDLVVTGPLDPLFDRKDDFTILQGVNSSNPCPFNGSVWSLKAGYRPDIWSDFSLDAARAVPFDKFPDDQAWFAAKMPDAAAFTSADGVYAFKKRGWPDGDALPSGARIVAFPGWRDPSKFEALPWVKENWRA
ncbi:hypothetical protein [Bradyrhizobium sp. URHD0069]|uniref:hypothetical protein n=1 Tax=Bradyrhizobium sp. URHD0069 TaxID=1380355 RepID=UPI0005618EA1|nr:hypothetical protein [Bradyrhizobium sp. URHD0069]